MRAFFIALFFLFATAAQADFLTDHAGHWEGEGTTTDGVSFTLYAHINANGAKWSSVNDGCEGTWDFQKVSTGLADGWEDVTVGADRCYVGLRVVLTSHDASRIKAEWYQMNGMFVAEALFWPVQ